MYLSAKIILNVRDVQKWYTSMHQTLFIIFRWPSWHILRYTDPSFCRAWCRHNELIWDYFSEGEYTHRIEYKERFERHNEFVKRLVGRERLLEYEIGQGWKSVAEFLALDEFEGNVRRLIVESVWRLSMELGGSVLGVVLCISQGWVYWLGVVLLGSNILDF